MITSNHTTKHPRANWDFAWVKQALNSGRVTFSTSAGRDYRNLGMTRDIAMRCLHQLTEHNFYCSYHYADGNVHDSYRAYPYIWFDENEECEQRDNIFIKLCLGVGDCLIIERFHCDNGGL